MESAVAGPGLSTGPLESADSSALGSPLGPQSPPAHSIGAGPTAGTTGALFPHCAQRLGPRTLWAALRPQPCVSPDGAVTTVRVGHQGENRDSVTGVRAWQELWSLGSSAPSFSPGGLFSPEFSQCLGSRVSDPSFSAPRLSLPGTDGE